MSERKTWLPYAVNGLLCAAMLFVGIAVGRGTKAEAPAPEKCDPPGVRADPAAVEAFFTAWSDPAARGAIGPDTAPETVLAEAVRLVLHSEQGGFEGFNVYLTKSALSFSPQEIEDVGTKLAAGKHDERLAAFRAIVGSDLKSALLVDAVLHDPRITTAPSPAEPAPEDPDEEPVEETAPAPPQP